MSPPVVALVMSMTGEVPLTSTVSETPPTVSSLLSVVTCPERTSTFSFRHPLNPVSSTVTTYSVDGTSASSRARPFSSVTCTRRLTVSFADAVTVAPGTMRPSLSTTMTSIVPDEATWA